MLLQVGLTVLILTFLSFFSADSFVPTDHPFLLLILLPQVQYYPQILLAYFIYPTLPNRFCSGLNISMYREKQQDFASKLVSQLEYETLIYKSMKVLQEILYVGLNKVKSDARPKHIITRQIILGNSQDQEVPNYLPKSLGRCLCLQTF